MLVCIAADDALSRHTAIIESVPGCGPVATVNKSRDYGMEARVGLVPTNEGFADLSSTRSIMLTSCDLELIRWRLGSILGPELYAAPNRRQLGSDSLYGFRPQLLSTSLITLLSRTQDSASFTSCS